jgi:hypothetical protein
MGLIEAEAVTLVIDKTYPPRRSRRSHAVSGSGARAREGREHDRRVNRVQRVEKGSLENARRRTRVPKIDRSSGICPPSSPSSKAGNDSRRACKT